MQRAANVHEQISTPRLSEAADVLDDAAALDEAVDVLAAHTPTGETPLRGLLRVCGSVRAASGSA
jgi:hypothetical protein